MILPGSIIRLCSYIYTNHSTFERYSNAKHPISHGVRSAHACCCKKKVIVWFCVCTDDNPLANARGLSSRTDAQTINNLHLDHHRCYANRLDDPDHIKWYLSQKRRPENTVASLCHPCRFIKTLAIRTYR